MVMLKIIQQCKRFITSYNHVDNGNEKLTKRIKYLEAKYLQRQKRQRFNKGNYIYIVTTEIHEKEGVYKIGKTTNMTNRLSTYNTTEEHKVIFIYDCMNREDMDLAEKLVNRRLATCKIYPNRERFNFSGKICINKAMELIHECIKFIQQKV